MVVFETNTAMRPEVSRVLALVAMTAAAKVRSKIMCCSSTLCMVFLLNLIRIILRSVQFTVKNVYQWMLI